jgi:D-lactate dehydrogenase (cytochrome)
MTKDNIALAISALKTLIGDRLSTGESIREIHGRDEAYSTPALPDAVAFPESTEEVSKIMKICSQFQVPVVPFGIGTSLEGHVIPIHGGISVDTSRMNKVLEIHESDLDAVVQPGVSRTQLNDELRATGLMFTVDPWLPHAPRAPILCAMALCARMLWHWKWCCLTEQSFKQPHAPANPRPDMI